MAWERELQKMRKLAAKPGRIALNDKAAEGWKKQLKILQAHRNLLISGGIDKLKRNEREQRVGFGEALAVGGLMGGVGAGVGASLAGGRVDVIEAVLGGALVGTGLSLASYFSDLRKTKPYREIVARARRDKLCVPGKGGELSEEKKEANKRTIDAWTDKINELIAMHEKLGAGARKPQ